MGEDLAVAPVFLALSVPDLEASIKWYTESLDLMATRLPASPRAPQARVALLEGQGLLIELVEHPEAFDLEARVPGVQGRHLVHGLFKVGFYVRNLDATVERLGTRGARFKGSVFDDPVAGARSILLLDNNDNIIQLFEHLETKERAARQPDAQAQQMTALTTQEIRWFTPPYYTDGRQRAHLRGDSTKGGEWIDRVRVPGGSRVLPHSHPHEEVVTVIEGTWYLGIGERFDETKLTAYPAGSFIVIPPNVPHFLATRKDAAIVQVGGRGIFRTTYVER